LYAWHWDRAAADSEFDFVAFVLSACSNSKAASAPTLSGFAFVPLRAVFLDSARWVVVLAGEQDAADVHLRPTPSVQRGTPSPTGEA
jgi:hypothetical protein